MSKDAPTKEHNQRKVMHGLRWIGRDGASWFNLSNKAAPAINQQVSPKNKAGRC